ncbi:MAG: YlmC/YmxH family sporulation protein [Clostridiales bacterium]|jgi:YlmC/YmxH family sporulation protein|nr:YlmC/YmxH family sporulation protein [Clostridiales bacterium]
MINTQDIRNKEVINIYDGKSLGYVDDIEIDLEKGTVEGIVVPAERRIFQFFGREEDLVIRWKDIKRIGDDVVLVDVPTGNSLHVPLDMVYNDDDME